MRDSLINQNSIEVKNLPRNDSITIEEQDYIDIYDNFTPEKVSEKLKKYGIQSQETDLNAMLFDLIYSFEYEPKIIIHWLSQLNRHTNVSYHIDDYKECPNNKYYKDQTSAS